MDLRWEMSKYCLSKINAKNADHRVGVDEMTSCQALHTSMNGQGVSSLVIIRVLLQFSAHKNFRSLGFVIAKSIMGASISCTIRALLAAVCVPGLGG